MNTSLVEVERPRAQRVCLTEDTLRVDLSDGRTVEVPLDWYPRLLHGTPEERNITRLIGGGEGIHWPRLDEDLSVANLLAGKHSGESPSSFQHWIETRSLQRKPQQILAKAAKKRWSNKPGTGSGETSTLKTEKTRNARRARRSR